MCFYVNIFLKYSSLTLAVIYIFIDEGFNVYEKVCQWSYFPIDT